MLFEQMRPLKTRAIDENEDFETATLRSDHRWLAFEYLPFEIEIIRELDWIKNCDNFYLNTHITGLNNLVKITLAMYFVDNITRLRSLFSFIP